MVGIAAFLQLFSCNVHGTQVSQHQMVVRTAGNQIEAFLQQCLCHGLRILYHVMGIGLELRLHCFLQTDCLCRNHVLQRAALCAGKYGRIQLFAIFFLCQNQTAAGTTQRLVGGSRNNIRIGNGAHVCTAGNQTGNMCHIHHKNGANFVGDVRKHLEINLSGVCRRTGNDQLGLILLCQITDFIIIDQAGCMVHIIGHHVKIFAGNIGGTTVGQMTTVCQTHTHHAVTGLQQCQLHSHIGLSAGVGLYVGKFGTKQFLGTFNAKAFQLIHEVTAAVVTLAGKTFRVFVG